MKQPYQIVPTSSGWCVKRLYSKRASRKFKLKKDAIEYGNAQSKKEKVTLYIHKRNGMVGKRIRNT